MQYCITSMHHQLLRPAISRSCCPGHARHRHSSQPAIKPAAVLTTCLPLACSVRCRHRQGGCLVCITFKVGCVPVCYPLPRLLLAPVMALCLRSRVGSLVPTSFDQHHTLLALHDVALCAATCECCSPVGVCYTPRQHTWGMW
jgi:hypothetical protein